MVQAVFYVLPIPTKNYTEIKHVLPARQTRLAQIQASPAILICSVAALCAQVVPLDLMLMLPVPLAVLYARRLQLVIRSDSTATLGIPELVTVASHARQTHTSRSSVINPVQLVQTIPIVQLWDLIALLVTG